MTQTQSWEKSTPRKGPGCPFFFFLIDLTRESSVCVRLRACVCACACVGVRCKIGTKGGRGIDKRGKRGCRARIVSNRSLPGYYLYISRLLRVFFSARLTASLFLSLPAISLSLSVSLSSSSALQA